MAMSVLFGCAEKNVPDWVGAISLKPIVSAQHEFANRTEKHTGKRHYWRGDVAGLYGYSPNGVPLALIETSQAEADDSSAGGYPVLREKKPKSGYWFRALKFGDETTSDSSRYAVCAFPDSRAVNRWTFIVDHRNVIYRKDLGAVRGIRVFPSDPTAEGWEKTD